MSTSLPTVAPTAPLSRFVKHATPLPELLDRPEPAPVVRATIKTVKVPNDGTPLPPYTLPVLGKMRPDGMISLNVSALGDVLLPYKLDDEKPDLLPRSHEPRPNLGRLQTTAENHRHELKRWAERLKVILLLENNVCECGAALSLKSSSTAKGAILVYGTLSCPDCAERLRTRLLKQVIADGREDEIPYGARREMEAKERRAELARLESDSATN